MASSSKPKRIYDVFLSFRGTDVRNKFLSHLYKALDQNGIYTFRDSEELRKGDQISTELMKAIEESCIAIVIFSKDYASSQWCLEEVAKIMECNKQKHLKVLPVFYEVDPKEVRTGRESYARALKQHESKYGKESKKVKTWKEALLDAGSLSGWTLIDEDESKLIQEIVEKISTYLARTPLHVAKHPVGIDSQVVKLKSILNYKSDNGVLMVGLWGPGGIGKTSLAKALYNAMFRQFDGACFLEDVRKTSKDSRGLVKLQKILLDDILLLQQRLKVSSVDGGINLIQHRLGDKRVLLILDNVDDLCQLNALAGDHKWFGNGSNIIVTTRDKQLLTCHQIDKDHVYEVEALNHTEAQELLSKHAFQTHQIRKDLVDSALNYAKGLPLALVVLGSLLCGTTEDVWESTLKKLYRNPNKKINNVLKVSYDGLDENEKEIFLHIACFFKGQGREYTMKVLKCCDLEPAVGFDTLIKRSLISIEYEVLKVHDLVQAMGIDIVNQECKDDPGKRSRLWLYNDVHNVLQDNKGDCAVKAIVLKPPEQIEICIGPDAFTKMRKLRLLILHNVHISFQDPICLPNELRWLEWARCGHLILEFSYGPKELVALDISSWSITTPNQFKGFQNLKYLNVSECESLVRMPDLSCAPNLEELDLNYCKNLVEAHESIAYHGKLRKLIFKGCSKLSVFPNELKSKNLRTLKLVGCTKFERFPDIPHKLEALKELYLERTAIKGLPTSIENLVSLKTMVLSDCQKLISLPSSIYKLQNLEDLTFTFCANLVWFPGCEDSTDPCMKTKHSNLRGGNVTGVVKQFKGFQNLKYINFSRCESLVRMPDLSCTPNLEELDLRNCKNLVEAHESIAYHGKLKVLNFPGCSKLSVFPNELKSTNLQALHFENCTKFERFPDIPNKLEALKELNLEGTAIKGLPASIENLVSLKRMDVGHCKNLTSLPSSIYKLQNLEYLDLNSCTSLIRFPEYEDLADPCMKTKLSKLNSLVLSGCNLSEVDFLENLSCFPVLEVLSLSLNNITSLPTSINKRHRLSALDVNNCHPLQDIPELPPFLSYLIADNCKSLQNCGDLTSVHDFVRRGLTMADICLPYEITNYSISLPRGEMPEWVLPVENDYISFMASKDLYDKFLGLAFCVSFDKINYKEDIYDSYTCCSHVNGKRLLRWSFDVPPLQLDLIRLHYCSPPNLWGEVDFGRIDGSHAQFGLTVSGKKVKKWGFRIFCKQLEDDLKFVLQDNRLIDPTLLYEIDYESTYSEVKSLLMHKDGLTEKDQEAGSSHMHKDSPIEIDLLKQLQESSHMHEDSPIEIDLPKNFQDCQMSTAEHSRIGSKRKREHL